MNTTDQTEFKKRAKYKSPLILAEIAILVALAVVLSNIKVVQMPQGGSVTLASMAPIILLAVRRGPKTGITAGILYGVIQFMINPSVINPFQVLFDYPLAFGALGLVAFFPNKPVLGTTVAISVRFLMQFIAGTVWWAPVYAPSANPIAYSAIYNITYLLPELVISGIILYVLQKSDVIKAYM